MLRGFHLYVTSITDGPLLPEIMHAMLHAFDGSNASIVRFVVQIVKYQGQREQFVVKKTVATQIVGIEYGDDNGTIVFLKIKEVLPRSGLIGEHPTLTYNPVRRIGYIDNPGLSLDP